MKSNTARLLGVIQLVVEALVAIGYVVGLIPFLYLFSAGWVVPLTIASAVLGFLLSNRTVTPAIVNILMAFLSFIPIIGYVPRIIGIVISLYNIQIIRKTV